MYLATTSSIASVVRIAVVIVPPVTSPIACAPSYTKPTVWPFTVFDALLPNASYSKLALSPGALIPVRRLRASQV